MRPMPGSRAGVARRQGSLLGTVRSGGSDSAATAASGHARPDGAPGIRDMKATLLQSGVGMEAYLEGRQAEGLPVILDLGCGAKKVPGAFGVDDIALPGVDLVHDLEDTPYPLPENCADEIHLNHVLEHFENPLIIMEEIWRLARPHGRVLIRTPHYSGPYAWKDPTHRRAFSAESFHYFGENNYSYYTQARFR